jgi:phosphoenolpyruvate carboxylase
MEIVIRGRIMSQEKPSREQVLQRINELLDILKTISRDLSDVVKSLKEVEVPPAVPAPPTEVKKRSIEDVRTLFPKDLEEMLLFEEEEEYIVIKPRQYLGSENFAKIAAIIREQGGEYISAGKDSHFRVPREMR